MIDHHALDRFLHGAQGQALREGTRYAREARVGDFIGSTASVTTVVRGASGDFEVALWAEGGALQHRCSCPSWRDPCKHRVAAAMVLRQCLGGGSPGAMSGAPPGRARDTRPALPAEPRTVLRRGLRPVADVGRPRPSAAILGPGPVATPPLSAPIPALAAGDGEARRRAVEERVVAARRERLRVAPGEPPFLLVESPSGYAYRVQQRGGAEGPHSCDCPDFEANRLHTCKHVERVRAFLASRLARLSPAARRAARRPRIYLHFGEVVEPRLFGVPAGPGSGAVREAFDATGVPLRPLLPDALDMRRWLDRFGSWVEPQALAWLDERLRRRPVLPRAKIDRLVPPLKLKPYPYQWAGAAFLATSGRALLADEMGLGKTVQAILAAAALRQAERPVGSVTIVCPASLRGGWQDEIRRWLAEEATLLEGPAHARARTIAGRPAWLVCHYEQVLRDHAHHRHHAPDLLILDEAQRAKGLRTRTARVLKSIAAPYVFALTGTPLENRLEEAYAIAQLIDQRLLPPLWQIDRDHFVRDDRGRKVVMYRGLDALRSRLAPAFLRRRKEDVLPDLPGRLRSTVMVEMHEAVVATYDDVLAQVARIAAKKVILPADLDRMMRLLVIARRCCNGPHMLGHEIDDRQVPKLQELREHLRDLCLGEGRKAVVFSEWTDMTDRVEALCARLRLPAFHLHGGMPVRRRPALLREFAARSGPAVFVSTDAGGVGLNLQAADVVLNLDLPWNPARLEQRIARVHRIGSKRPVQEVLLVTRDSIEERILRLHDAKRNLLENIWAKRGEDVIAAPGGSGAFQQMVRALLRTTAPVVDGGDAPAPAGSPGPSGAPATARTPAPPPSPAPLHPRDRPQSPEQARSPVPPSLPEASAPAADPASLAAAVASIAPTLPPEHRRSLAAVFHALARALEA